MSDRCPRCGAARKAQGETFTVYECFTANTSDEGIVEGVPCLRNQLAQARKRIEELARERDDVQKESLSSIEALAQERDTLRAKLDDLLAQRMDEAEAKLATRPAEAVVGELEGKVRKLADILRSLVDLQEGPPLPSTAPVWELVMDEAFDALKEVEGGA